MFQKLNKKFIRYIIILTTSFFLIISGLTAYYFIDFIEQDFAVKVEDNLELSVNNFVLQKALLETSFFNFVANDSIINYSKSQDDTQEAIKRLDALVYSNELIAGATIYNNSILSSSNISNAPSLSSLRSLENIKVFLDDSEATHFFDIRCEYIASSFGYTTYNQDFGIASYFVKIIDQTQTVGILEVDLNSEFIYNHFFNYSSNLYLGDSISFITNKIDYLKNNNNDNDNYENYLTNLDKDSFYRKNRHYIKTHTIDETSNLIAVIIVPTYVTSYYKIVVVLILIVIDIISILLAFIISKFLSKRITTSLFNLYQKIENSEHEFKPFER